MDVNQHVGVLLLTELRRAGVQHAKFTPEGQIIEVVMLPWEEPRPTVTTPSEEMTPELQAELEKRLKHENGRDLYGAG